MTARFIVALDLGQKAHVGYIYDTTTQRLSKALRVPVSAQGRATGLFAFALNRIGSCCFLAATGWAETTLHDLPL